MHTCHIELTHLQFSIIIISIRKTAKTNAKSIRDLWHEQIEQWQRIEENEKRKLYMRQKERENERGTSKLLAIIVCIKMGQMSNELTIWPEHCSFDCSTCT